MKHGRLIDADALMPRLEFIREAEHQIYGKESWGFASKCITAVEDAPTIEERKTGKWDFIGDNMFACSGCGTPYTLRQLSNLKVRTANSDFPKFCPNCGTDMRGDEDG